MPEVWERWLAWDPVRMVDRYADALRGLRAVWIDAGTQRRVLPRPRRRRRSATAWPAIGVPDDRVHFELFEATHAGIDYRYPLALTWLAHRLAR